MTLRLTLPALPDAGFAAECALPGGSALALAIAQVAQAHTGLVLAIATSEQQAYRLQDELAFFLPRELPLLHFPDTEVLPYDQFSPHQELLSARLDALHRLPHIQRGVFLISANTLLQRLPPRDYLDGRRFDLKAGDRLDPTAFRARLTAAGYVSVSEVQTQGEVAVRGAVVDVFPMGSEQAFRLDLFDNTIESIRIFDPETQRSNEKTDAIRLLPAREFPTDGDGIEGFRRRYRQYFSGDLSRSRIYGSVGKGLMPAGIESWMPLFFETTGGLASYLPEDTLVVEAGDVSGTLAQSWNDITERHERYGGDLERPLMRPQDLFIAPESSMAEWRTKRRLLLKPAVATEATAQIGIEATQQLLRTTQDRILFAAESAGRREALLIWLKPLGINPAEIKHWSEFADSNGRYGLAVTPLQDNLVLPGAQLLAEARIFGQTAPAQTRRRTRVRDPETLLRDLGSLTLGAPVVHVQHGVGRYRGLEKMSAGGTEAEYLILEYAGGDKLYVPVASLSLIHRYTGAETDAAPLHSLGSDRWEKARKRARERAHDVAAELLQVQARRATRPALSLQLKDEDYRRFCSGFPFETTPDQQKAIDAVLADLQADKPMDRVVCGDVGFGKTEVALRAAFAAAQAGRQVCVLAPTTLLVEQHAKNFRDRFAGWPLRIGALSRLRGDKEQAAQIQALNDGALDIVIGTHRLLQGDVSFKNLGLVIIDEEHRFGVRHKERLKNLRAEVDVLTLTATPIPRTLNLSLAGLRDLSIIATPPQGRLAIKTFVAEHERALIIEACQRELRRGGQVYYLHNEVKDIETTAQTLREWLPDAGVRVAHGQMRERELEQVMLDFYHQRFNVLVCTTIIESGIDVPSANTLIVDRADELGLAQLHQLRGRVGRSHHRAYAYLLVPLKRALKPDAAKRLDAIESMGELGAGFMLATHDLEIRGAGELLGEGQSGQMEEVGFTLYADLLAQAVRAIKSGDLRDAPLGQTDCEVDLGSAALIPDDYVPDVHARLVLYKRIAEAPTAEALAELKGELMDRFGTLPAPTDCLLLAAAVKLQGRALGVTKLRAGSKAMSLQFGGQAKVNTTALIRLIQSQPRLYRLEGQTKLHYQFATDEVAARASAAAQLLTTLATK